MVIKCDGVLSKISDYLEDDLDPALKRAIQEHIAQCRQCRAVLEGLGTLSHSTVTETCSACPPASTRGCTSDLQIKSKDNEGRGVDGS